MGAFERKLLIALTAAIILLAPGRGPAQPVCLTCPPNGTSYTLMVPPGWSLIANPLSHYRGATVGTASLDDRVSEVFKRVPTGTRLYKFDNTMERFTENVFLGNHWARPNQTLSPGEGAFVFNPKAQPFQVIITGNCDYAGLAVAKGLSLISSPACGNINFARLVWPPAEGGPWAPVPGPGWDNLSFNPQEGDDVYTFRHASQSYEIHRFRNGAWDSQPSVGEGESFFVRTSVAREIAYTAPRPY